MAHDHHLQGMLESFDRAGRSPQPLRQAVRHHARALAEGLPGAPDSLEPPLRSLVEKVVRSAYKVTDEDVAAVRATMPHDDDVFELVVIAAHAAAEVRLERALAALASEEGST